VPFEILDCGILLKDEALEESANLPAPEIIAQEIAADLEAALEQFATIAEDLK
jgi:type I restriction enzyme M protein